MDFWTDIWPATLAAQQMLTSVGDDMSRLPESVRIFLLVNGAQGVIDNGGYNCFFGQDWPGNPPYGDFADAYEAIGCMWERLAAFYAMCRKDLPTFRPPKPLWKFWGANVGIP
jgi:hypothetical protein